MPDYTLVFNAGSSSLKFCAFAQKNDGDWQIDVPWPGRRPRHRPANLRPQRSGPCCPRSGPQGRCARPARRTRRRRWLAQVHIRAGQVTGVGHRVVHGGTRYTGPTVVTPEVLADLHGLEQLAPLHQPHNLAAIEAVS